MDRREFCKMGVQVVEILAITLGSLIQKQAVSALTVGTPYWYNSSILTDAVAQQAVDGGYRTVFWVAQRERTQLLSQASQLAIARQHGLLYCWALTIFL